MLSKPEIPDDVQVELDDPEFSTRTHGKRATYSKGCHGPLCQKAERDSGPSKYARRRARDGKPEPREGLKDDVARARDELLTRIQYWHEHEREMKRHNRLVQPDLTLEDLARIEGGAA